MKKSERLKEAIKLMRENEEKYRNLVWFARKDEQKLLEEERYDILAEVKRVEKKYPEETKSLKNSEEGDWSHGYNSGALAYTRLYLEMIEGSIDCAIENHPFLDS